jgi:8-oxo-dGTP pyrophosphatase MutT (NUDIX family)
MAPASPTIRVMALCVFRDRDRLLVNEGFDSIKQRRYARPLGGGVDHSETTLAAIQREIREELGQEIQDLRLLGVLENIFTYEGKPGHEIVFIYDGQFADRSLYEKAEIPMFEPGWTTPAIWRSIDSFGPECELVPKGLRELLVS